MHEIQTSESFTLGALLATAGGFMDAYSYICRGKVFANAQTGNMLLLGVSIAEGDKASALRYFTPVAAFALGIVAAELIQYFINEKPRSKESLLHWRQLTLIAEILCFIPVMFMPQSMNLWANSITSLACGLQVQTFRVIHGCSVATTMCIGNLRSGTENLCGFITTKNKRYLKSTLLYYGIIFCFIVGAVAGNFVIGFIREKAIMVCIALLFAAFLLMFRKTDITAKNIK